METGKFAQRSAKVQYRVFQKNIAHRYFCKIDIALLYKKKGICVQPEAAIYMRMAIFLAFSIQIQTGAIKFLFLIAYFEEIKARHEKH